MSYQKDQYCKLPILVLLVPDSYVPNSLWLSVGSSGCGLASCTSGTMGRITSSVVFTFREGAENGERKYCPIGTDDMLAFFFTITTIQSGLKTLTFIWSLWILSGESYAAFYRMIHNTVINTHVNVSLAAASLLKIKSAEYSSAYRPPYLSASSKLNFTHTKAPQLLLTPIIPVRRFYASRKPRRPTFKRMITFRFNWFDIFFWIHFYYNESIIRYSCTKYNMVIIIIESTTKLILNRCGIVFQTACSAVTCVVRSG